MFISVLDLFKIGIGPSSSHTMGPMTAANVFRDHVDQLISQTPDDLNYRVYCVLKGSLAFTGRGHATDRAVALGLHGHSPVSLAGEDVNALTAKLWATDTLQLTSGREIGFNPEDDIVFDKSDPLPQHPNGMIFYLLDEEGKKILSETFFSIGGGFICTLAEINQLNAPLKMESAGLYPYPFDSAIGMLEMSQQSGLSIAEMKRANELTRMSAQELEQGLDSIWKAMCHCVEQGLTAEGRLPGGLSIRRRAKDLYEQLQMHPEKATLNDWLCAYAMAVNEENAAGHMVVTAPTNGAAGVIPAVIYYLLKHEGGTEQQVRDFLLTAAAIGGLIKHLSSISGAEVGCQGEVGSAAAMAAAGLCAVRGGTTEQVENAAEIALEHHLGMTCDPVGGLVQVPCIERNGFGAIKAHTAAALACRGTGEHFIPLDNCINAMKQTGLEMSHKYKETSLGGLAVSVSITEC
ncbi:MULTISPECIES: L-serine ammonia-lyase [Nitrosomonas]|uniref:L-serine ammonia-lyase n=1 Tax=Nitrosomonas TaxID=914 RepID=UPI00079661CC|nr:MULTISPECIES: L-serine ammonia-lyase [Nitrosomonas]KXK41626.1 MAG: Iron-sulfur-dependent L-serine dehydratase single chain form [Nitrosomonas europaea]MBV6390626.1 L-serine dehydratase TdcG [Nitrosomonas europaea]QOJ09517.1 MAG: L-serine ammonia-lyase [Nitrosomonas sp. H1_AOB3]HNS58649.1 L-serine ammonia-lyase [Nitrosomonas europaea]HRN82356.1 L-serine ammonia-lyase [Nitrosomonas europaea]